MGTMSLQALRDELSERFGPDWRGACFGRNISNFGLGLATFGGVTSAGKYLALTLTLRT